MIPGCNLRRLRYSLAYLHQSRVGFWFCHPATDISRGATDVQCLREYHGQHPVPGGVLSGWKRRIVRNRDRVQPSHMLRSRCVGLAGSEGVLKGKAAAQGWRQCVRCTPGVVARVALVHSTLSTCTFSIECWFIPSSSNVALHSLACSCCTYL